MTCTAVHESRSAISRRRAAQFVLEGAVTMTASRPFTALIAARSIVASPRLHTFVLSAGLLVACAMPDDDTEYGVAMSEVSVSTYTTSSCSTSVVLGLSKQIAEEVGCMNA